MRWRGFVFGAAALLACGRSEPPAAAAPLAPRPATLKAELVLASYWGAPGGSALRSGVFDAAGNFYIVGGSTTAPQWPRSAPPLGALGSFDVIVAKFDPAGRNLWSLVMGSATEDYAYVSALDRDGNLLVGGRAGRDFPTTEGAFDRSFNGGFGRGPHDPSDGFLLSLTPAGALRWSTYLGSSGDDVIRGIEVLPDGGIAVSGGNTDRGDLPTTPGVVKPALGGAKDAYVAVVAADGASVRFVTYVGPSDDDEKREDETVRAIATDPDGNLWLAGTTKGADLTPTSDAFQPAHGGGASAFVAKLTPDGRRIPYFSWLGGSAGDDVETEGRSDPSGGFLIAGGTDSADFPATPGATALGVPPDGWLARVSADGALAMAARFGGSGRDHVFGPALARGGSLWIAGTTTSRDLPVTDGAPQVRFSGGDSDALLAAFDASGALAFATYWGGAGTETGRFVVADSQGRRVLLLGESSSTNLPLRHAAQTTPGGVYFAMFEIEPMRP